MAKYKHFPSLIQQVLDRRREEEFPVEVRFERDWDAAIVENKRINVVVAKRLLRKKLLQERNERTALNRAKKQKRKIERVQLNLAKRIFLSREERTRLRALQHARVLQTRLQRVLEVSAAAQEPRPPPPPLPNLKPCPRCDGPMNRKSERKTCMNCYIKSL